MGTVAPEGQRQAPSMQRREVFQTTVAYLGIDGMVCGRCALRVRHALLQREGVVLVGLSLDDKMAYVAYQPSSIQPAQLREIVEQASQGSPYHYEVTLVRTLPSTALAADEQNSGCQLDVDLL